MTRACPNDRTRLSTSTYHRMPKYSAIQFPTGEEFSDAILCKLSPEVSILTKRQKESHYGDTFYNKISKFLTSEYRGVCFKSYRFAEQRIKLSNADFVLQ
jgi:hypothetical protein